MFDNDQLLSYNSDLHLNPILFPAFVHCSIVFLIHFPELVCLYPSSFLNDFAPHLHALIFFDGN